MRKNLLPIAAGVFGSLALALSASADFVGLQTEMKGTYNTADALDGPDVGLVDVWNLYALLDDPNDSLTGIFVLAAGGLEMTHSSDLASPFDGLGGGFWNWSLGADRPLDADGIYAVDPAAADADTYLTIGLKSGSFPDGDDRAFFAPGSHATLIASGILNGSGSITDDFGYNATPDDAQTYPVDGRVLMLQITVLSGEHASGIWNFKWGNTGAAGGGQAMGVIWSTVPAPGALALLGLVGLAGTRRRRLLKSGSRGSRCA